MKKGNVLKRIGLTAAIATAITVSIAAILYITFVYSNIPFISYWRTIWIETAMTTGDHQWLATSFVPENIINDVMQDFGKGQTDVLGGGGHLQTKPPDKPSPGETGSSYPSDEPDSSSKPGESGSNPADILGQLKLAVGAPDKAGNTVLINDIEQGIVVSEIIGSNYKGKIMLIDNPSRVFLGVTPYKDAEGLRIKSMMEHYDAVAGINASGFSDPGGEGHGGDIIGLSCSNGEFWGSYVNYYGSVIFTPEDKLVVGNVSVWEDYEIRDGIQFGPVLIADGVKQFGDSGGYGIHPRTAIGQREDGVIAFLVIDGRNPLHSVGCTVADLADILLSYDIINASCCDGGSSSALAYDGEIITKNSSLYPALGRRLPNAFLVSRKTSD